MFTAVATNETEKAAPGNTLVEVQMIGAAGRVTIGDDTEAIAQVRDTITSVLEAVEGRTR